jgi:hypothetical protein
LACQQPESQGRWTVRTLARKLGLPHSTVHAILRASQLQPHRSRTFSFSPDPEFEPKVLDSVGLYLDPPENALVLGVDEKPGIQALDRTQPLLPLRAKKPQSWTHEYVRHGTQTLIAALEMATGRVVAHVRNRRTSVNFLRFMNEVMRAYPDLNRVRIQHVQPRESPFPLERRGASYIPKKVRIEQRRAVGFTMRNSYTSGRILCTMR